MRFLWGEKRYPKCAFKPFFKLNEFAPVSGLSNEILCTLVVQDIIFSDLVEHLVVILSTKINFFFFSLLLLGQNSHQTSAMPNVTTTSAPPSTQENQGLLNIENITPEEQDPESIDLLTEKHRGNISLWQKETSRTKRFD